MSGPVTENCGWCGQPKSPAPDGDFITCPNAHDICLDCCPCCPGKYAKCVECGKVLAGVPSTFETLESLCPEHQNNEGENVSEQTDTPDDVTDEEFFERGYQHYAKVARVTATVHFDVYIVDGERVPYSNGRDLDETITDEICDAIGYRAVHGTDTEPGDAMIAMVERPSDAVELTGISVEILDAAVDPVHVVDQAEGTSGEL